MTQPDILTDVLRDGVRQMLATAIEADVEDYIEDRTTAVDAIGLGFWSAVRKVFPKTRQQRCWVHKTANVLNKLPKGIQPKATAMLHDIWMAKTKEAADQAFDLCVSTFAAKFAAATGCLEKDREMLLTF